MELKAIEIYLAKRLGKRGVGRTGLARLIQEFEGYLFTDIQDYIEVNELNVKSNKREKVYLRSYLYAYLRYEEDMSLTTIGKMFNKHHSTIIFGLKNYDNLEGYNDRAFKTITKELRESYKITRK